VTRSLDFVYLMQEIKQYVIDNGADGLLDDLILCFPDIEKEIERTIINRHGRDYDKKKAALLQHKE